MTEQPRITTARDNDDSDLIDSTVPDEDAVPGSAGGNLQRDIGSKADLIRAVDDPDAEVRPEKADDIANDQAYDSDRRGDSG